MKNVRAAVAAVWWKIRTEPVVVVNAATALIAAGVSLGLYSAEQSAQVSGTVAAVIVAVGTLFARRKVTPVTKLDDHVDHVGYVGDEVDPSDG